MSVIKSKNKAFNESSKKDVPICKLDTNSLTVTIFNADTQTEEYHTFHSDYIKYHVHYVAAKYKERLQKYVDNGTIFEYLSNLEMKAIETENRQVERWKKSDKEYLSAIESGDERKQIGLLNNMHYRARECVLDCMIYV